MENMNQVVNETETTQAVENKEIVDTQENKTEKDVKTFTQDELDKIIKSNVDRALAKAKAEAEEKQEEAKKLAKMNAEQKANYEYEQREEKLLKREKDITRRELEAEAKTMLAEEGLSTEISSILDYTNAETVKESLTKVSEVIKKEAQRLTKETLKGETPKISNNQDVSAFDQVRSRYK